MKLNKLIFIVILAAASLLTFSCKDNKGTGKSHDLKPASEERKVKITDEDKKEIEAFSEELGRTINEGDSAFLAARFNIQRLGELAREGITLSPKEMSEVEKGMNSSLPSAKQQLVQMISSSQVKFIKLVQETRPALLYRLILEDGSFTYCEFILEKRRSDQQWEIIDLYLYANGQRTSSLMREVMAQMLPAAGKTDAVMVEAMEQAQKVANLNNAGNYQEAWDAWEKIDSKAYKNKAILMQGYMAAFQIYYSDLESTAQLLNIVSIMEKQFPGDAGLAILQLSIHEINKDSKKYLVTVQKIRDQVGDDPFLDYFESNADLIDEDYDAALKKALAFKELEPDLAIVDGTIWMVYHETKDYNALGAAFDSFMDQYGVDVTAFSGDTNFKPFFDSPEGKAWLEKYQE